MEIANINGPPDSGARWKILSGVANTVGRWRRSKKRWGLGNGNYKGEIIVYYKGEAVHDKVDTPLQR